MKAVFAITGTAFFISALAAMIYVGDINVQRWAIGATLVAGFSQFVAQEDGAYVRFFSVALSYIGMFMALTAMYLL